MQWAPNEAGEQRAVAIGQSFAAVVKFLPCVEKRAKSIEANNCLECLMGLLNIEYPRLDLRDCGSGE
jgi:hypothetical protein